ncbi:MAG: hypothetical protein QM796_02630 [Chthoniobacteraceae bacterium]
MDKQTLIIEATKWRNWFYKGQRNWSKVHHVTLFGSVGCSLAAGALLQIDKTHYAGLAAILTSMAAALTGIATSGGFERKWRSNRLSRSRVDTLLIDLNAEPPDLSAATADLKDIIIKHDIEIVGEKQTSKQQAGSA